MSVKLLVELERDMCECKLLNLIRLQDDLI